MLIWADPFDHYGNTAAMLLGTYADVFLVLDTASQRNGTTCLHLFSDGIGSRYFRRTLGDAKAVVGFGAAFKLTALPNDRNIIFCQGRDLSGTICWTISQTNDGRIRAWKGDFATLLGTSGQVLAVNAYQHFESKVFTDALAGSIEVRINGETVLDVTGADTAGAGGSNLPSQIFVLGGGTQVYVDDMFAWDDQGDYVNDFIGDHRVRLAKLISDTAQADWTPNVSSATGFEMLTEIPNDGDTTYIEAAEPYLASEFEFEPVPDDVASIAGIMLVGLQRKTDAGTCNTQLSLVSGISEGLGAETALSQLYTYYDDAMVTDPNTGAPFLPADLSAARLKITRTA